MNKFRGEWRKPKIKIAVLFGVLILAVIIVATVWIFAKSGNKSSEATNPSENNADKSQNQNHDQNQSQNNDSANDTNSAKDDSQKPSPSDQTAQTVSLKDATSAVQKSTGNQQAQATSTLKTSGAWSVVKVNIGQNTAVAIFNGDSMVVPPGTGFLENFLLSQGVPADLAQAVAGN